jgi:hypothetical protein
MNMVVNINEPYWGAGTKFGWDKAYGQHGISIRKSLLASMPELEVTIGKAPYNGKKYKIESSLALSLGKVNFAKGTELVCFPTSLLVEQREANVQ